MCVADEVMNARFAYQESVHQEYKQSSAQPMLAFDCL